MRSASGRAVGGEVEETVARVGGGAPPPSPSFACAVEEELATALRQGEPPVIGVVRDGRLLLDCRTLSDAEIDEVSAAVVSARGSTRLGTPNLLPTASLTGKIAHVGAEIVPSLCLGTAGHIDHGKTWLVRALTGKDTDRLPEEQERGISIDLGYALPSTPRRPADLPHRRPGSRAVHPQHGRRRDRDRPLLLVIDAGEGARAQTHEHLAILRMLGIERGVVAVTKADAVAADTLEPAVDEARELVPGADVVAVSAKTGAGLDALRAALATAADFARATPQLLPPACSSIACSPCAASAPSQPARSGQARSATATSSWSSHEALLYVSVPCRCTTRAWNEPWPDSGSRSASRGSSGRTWPEETW